MHEALHHRDRPAFPLQVFSDLIDLKADLFSDQLFQQLVRMLCGGHGTVLMVRWHCLGPNPSMLCFATLIPWRPVAGLLCCCQFDGMKQASLLRRIGTYLLGLVDEYWAMRRPWQYGANQPQCGLQCDGDHCERVD